MKRNWWIIILIFLLSNSHFLFSQQRKLSKSSSRRASTSRLNAKFNPNNLYVRRVNVGGDHFVDKKGHEWHADQEYQAGVFGYIGDTGAYTSRDKIKYTKDDIIYKTERYGLERYKFDVPNGHYKVILHFAEIYFTENARRIMDIKIEGKLVLRNLDIHLHVGHDAPLIYSFSTRELNRPVTDGCLDIEFIHKKEDTKISGIEVIQLKHTEPLFEITSKQLDFGITETDLTFQVSNFGSQPLNWSISPNSIPAWIRSIEPMRGTLLPGKEEIVALQARRSVLTSGIHETQLKIIGSGLKKNIRLSIAKSGPRRLKSIMEILDFGSGKCSLPLVIQNVGGGPLEWMLDVPSNVTWLGQAFPASGILGIGEKATINVNATRKSLARGEHHAKLTIHSDGGNKSILAKIRVPISSARLIYVDCNATGMNNGTSWRDAFQRIQDAIKNVSQVARNKTVEIWVARGPYYEHNILVKTGIHLYGGFRGDELSREERQNPWNNPTIIDAQNLSRCLECEHRTVVDGFVIQNGRVWQGGDGNGAGIYMHDTDVKIRNNFIRNNVVSWAGGAIFVEGFELSKNVRGVSPLIERNLIINNKATYCAAGIEIRGSRAVIRNNTIVNNTGYGLEIQTLLGPYKTPILGDFYNNIVIGNRRNGEFNVWAVARKVTNYSLVGNKWSLAGEYRPYTHGTGNVFTDESGLRPKFVDPANSDFHLMADSPCIDNGSPKSERDPDQTRADMGVFVFNQKNSNLVPLPTSLNFGTWETAEKVVLNSYGAKPVNWSAVAYSKDGWITSIEPSSGHLENGEPVQITVFIDREELLDGHYFGKIAVMSEIESHEIPIQMAVNRSKPEIKISSKSIAVMAPVGGLAPIDPTIIVSNSGVGALIWRASLKSNDHPNWLKLINATGFDGDEFNLNFNITNLRVGTYRQMVQINCDEAINSPLLIPVILNMTPPQLAIEIEAESSPSLPNSGWKIAEYEGEKCIEAIKRSMQNPNNLTKLDYEFSIPDRVDFVYIFAEVGVNRPDTRGSFWIKLNDFDLCRWKNLCTSKDGLKRVWIFKQGVDKQHKYIVRPGKNKLNLFTRETGCYINWFVVTNDPNQEIDDYNFGAVGSHDFN